MTETAEVRWFVPGPLPPDAAAWFAGLGPLPDEEARTDRYLVPQGPDGPGVKLRGGRLEVKRRTETHGTWPLGAAEGRVEAWAKWSFPLVPLLAETPDAGWTPVGKRRRVHAFVVEQGAVRPAGGEASGGVGRVELAALTRDGAPWWSVCVEAEAPDGAARLAALQAVAAYAFGPGTPSALSADASMGYPAWLADAARP